ncbi:glutamine amidotransferase [Dickeya sp. CFBP 2040]|uniref:glutamine amidotransferase n=1 Tax=Dickeya sp. CFBP 2040 TaxID=2718531 RepID=UPI001444D5A9|nr:glutamine amidotransferase [Dickeya sp. CFBP 2040]NKI75931.1 glutamine amidotransferase [Dickeya sp. CFBP 2040]
MTTLTVNSPTSSRPPSLLIVQMGEPPEPIANAVGQQADWFGSALADEGVQLHVVRPDAGEHDAAIISGSWSMVTDRLDWSERTAEWLRQCVQVGLPVLGVCYGHQLLAHALGGTVADNPNGREMGLKTVTLHDRAVTDALLTTMPTQFSAYLSHLQSVVVPPPGAQVLAASEQDGCQIIRYTSHTLSFQFHPEMDAAVMNACLRHCALPEITDSAEPVWARRLLLDFVRQALSR